MQAVLALFEVMLVCEPSFVVYTKLRYLKVALSACTQSKFRALLTLATLRLMRCYIINAFLCLLIVRCKWQLSIIFFTFYLGFYWILNINKAFYVHTMRWFTLEEGTLNIYRGASVYIWIAVQCTQCIQKARGAVGGIAKILNKSIKW